MFRLRCLIKGRRAAEALLWLTLCVCGATIATAGVKKESFDHDPDWEGFNNEVHPAQVPLVIQDFGYTAAGSSNGPAVGGRITRASRPASYAQKIAAATLGQPLSASGSFRITSTSGGSGVFFGWFDSRQPGGSGRPRSSFGLDIDGERGGARLAVRMISANNTSCGTFVTPFIPGKYRPTPIHNDGRWYHWTITYDPQANDARGRFTFKITSDSAQAEDFEGKLFSVDLPEGFKSAGASFDRFGLMNMLKSGSSMTPFFSGLQLNGEAIDPAQASQWVGVGNHEQYAEEDPAGAHHFGYSPRTSYAGGSAGEMGGKFWRSGNYAYYADRLPPLDLTQKLEASGKVALLVGAPDSDMFLGWFNSTEKKHSPVQGGNFLGVHIGGPTRVGHYFQPVYVTGEGSRGAAKRGPVLVPEKVYSWRLIYDPQANDGRGSIQVKLGDDSITLDLKPGHKSEATHLDRFGVCTSNIGGQMLRIYFDDLSYTASAAASTNAPASRRQ
jgi:hypothetical protein